MIYGVDVSHYQGNIDWKKVADSGKKFAILKCMYENSHKVDEYFEKNYEGCIKNGLGVGIYIYHARKSIEKPNVEAEDILKILKNRTLNYGIWHDLEDKNIRSKGKSYFTNFLKLQDEYFSKYQTGIYCNVDWYKNVLDSKELSKKYKFWIARYPSQDKGIVVESLSPKSYSQGWQYSSKGKVPGINGNVDLDIDFGTLAVTASDAAGSTLGKDIRIVTASHLNARVEPSTGAVLHVLDKGDKVNVVETKGNWCKIEAWVSSAFLK